LSRREARGGPGGDEPLDGLAIAIFGPTASGKSAIAEAIADIVAADVISADAMQAYRGVPILTNQPQRPTELVAIWPLDHEGSVGEYAELAHAAIDRALAARRIPLIAGGTGLYLRAAIAELEVPPAPAPPTRAFWERVYDRLGAAEAHAALQARDARAAEAVHPNDRRRVVRALELADAGHSLRPDHDRLWSARMRHPTLVVGLDVPRDALAARITARTAEMIGRGAREEAEAASVLSLSRSARGIIGLRELIATDANDAAAAIDTRTRRYAAYQRKWMRRIPGIVTVDADRSPVVVAHEILEMARARERLPARRAG
jgi:tRNA dimethylallyltransferase